MSGFTHRRDDEAFFCVSARRGEVNTFVNDTEQWERLQQLFHLLEQTAEADRVRVLDEQCPEQQLRQRILAMIEGANLSEPEPPLPELPFAGKIGPYSLLRLLGTGGIGSVYLAERIRGGAPVHEALKVIAPHAAGASFVERFHREQHILGLLDHPHITRMLDVGVSAGGQPYLAMEYVRGVHLTEYCHAHKLGVHARIELFLQVCDGIAYAHRSLIVHLDLKPSNILVTDEGRVKVLDFGTSKLINTDSLLTTTVLATPAFASPEQLRNEPVTTACDIFSLGTVLSVLLAGERAANRSNAALIFERAMREAEPEPLGDAVTEEAAAAMGLSLGRLRQLVSGDLATIVAKCLRPRPQDRYVSVDALAEDLRRYLEGRAVLARSQTTTYRVSKFVRRHRRGLTVAAAVLVVLSTTLTYAVWRQHQAVEEGRRALRMQDFLYRLFRLANSNDTGKPAATVPEFLALGVRMLPDYIRDPVDLRAAQLGLAESMYQNGDLEGAQKVFLKVSDSAEQAGDLHAEAEAEAFAGNIAYLQGQMHTGERLTAHALELSRKAGTPPAVRVWSEVYYAWNREDHGYRSDENLRLLEDAAKRAREANLPARETADVFYNLGEDLELRGRLDEADILFQQTLDVYSKDPNALCDQSEVYGDFAYNKEMQGEVASSLPLYEKALEGYTRCSGPQSRGALTEQEYYAGALIKLGHAQAALALMQTAMPVWRRLLGDSPDLDEPLNFLALSEIETGHYVEGERDAHEMVTRETGRIAATDRRFGMSHMLWARALAGQGEYREALPHAEIANTLLAQNALSPGAKKVGADAHQLLLSVQEKLKMQ
jgi:serine/threonine protein kinase